MSFWQSQLIAKPVRQKKHEDDISLKLLTWKENRKKGNWIANLKIKSKLVFDNEQKSLENSP